MLHRLDGRERFVVVAGVEVGGVAELFVAVEAVNLLRFAFGLGERGQKHGREDGDDRDDDEQFDQSEALARGSAHGLRDRHGWSLAEGWFYPMANR